MSSFDYHSGILDVDAFKREIVHVFQNTEATLRAHVNTTYIERGDGIYFPLIGSTNGMQERSGDGDLAFSSRTNSRVQVTITFKALKDQIIKEDIQKSQVDPRGAVVQSQMFARNREFDSAVLTALDLTTESHTLVNGSYITWADIRSMRAKLRRNNVPTGGVIFVLSPDAFSQIMNIEELTSGDYCSDKRLENSQAVYNALGMTFIEHTSLSGVGTTACKCFAYNKMAVGHCMPGAVSAESVDIDWDGSNKRWTITTDLYHGAKIIQDEGVIEFSHDDTADQSA